MNEETLIWLGPRNQGDIQQMFDHYFSKTACLDADALALSSEEEHAAYMATLTKSQGNFARASETLTPQRCMTPIEYARFEKYKELYAAHAASNAEGAFVVDLSQSMEHKRIGKFLPTACQSSKFFSFTKDGGRYFAPQDRDGPRLRVPSMVIS